MVEEDPNEMMYVFIGIFGFFFIAVTIGIVLRISMGGRAGQYRRRHANAITVVVSESTRP